MKNQNLQAEINAINQESAQLEIGVEQSFVKKLLNIVERLASENEALKIEVQNLKDENNRLKGEQGKSDIKTNKKKRQRKPKLPKIKIDREQICVLDKSDLYRNGIAHSDYIQIDDTSAHVSGVNQYCQVVCSPLFTAYFTTPKKDRLTVLSVLTDFAPAQYLYNQQAQTLLATFNLGDKACASIAARLPVDVVMNELEFTAHLGCFDTLGVRHYKKLRPFVPRHQCALADFRSRHKANGG